MDMKLLSRTFAGSSSRTSASDLFSSTSPRSADDCGRRLGNLIKTNQCVTGMTITPVMAEVMLKQNTFNRPIKKKRVAMWSKSIRAGNWMLTGVPIVFSDEGSILDGQHRLLAIVETGMTIRCDVRFGIDKAAFKYYDIGAVRTNSDILSTDGNVDTIALAGALARWAKYEQGKNVSINRDNKIEGDESLVVLAKHPAIRDSISPARKVAKKIRHMRVIIGTFIHYTLWRIDPAMADEMFEYLHVPAGVAYKKNHPLVQLRSQFEANKVRMNDAEVAAICFNAWNKWRGDSSRLDLRWDSSKEFPRAI